MEWIEFGGTVSSDAVRIGEVIGEWFDENRPLENYRELSEKMLCFSLRGKSVVLQKMRLPTKETCIMVSLAQISPMGGLLDLTFIGDGAASSSVKVCGHAPVWDWFSETGILTKLGFVVK